MLERIIKTAMAGLSVVALACGPENYNSKKADTQQDSSTVDASFQFQAPPRFQDDSFGSTENCDPYALELCDGLDNNCNGLTDENVLFNDYFKDSDGDGFGDSKKGISACTLPTGYVVNADDCDDTNFSVNPNALEICDGLDNDCDGLIDNDVPDVGYLCGSDVGECKKGITDCINDAVICTGEIKPSLEICDGKDNDCNGAPDDSESLIYLTWFKDFDKDGQGDKWTTISDCKKPESFVENNLDPNDTNSGIKSGVIAWRNEEIQCGLNPLGLALGLNDTVYVNDLVGKLHGITKEGKKIIGIPPYAQNPVVSLNNGIVYGRQGSILKAFIDNSLNPITEKDVSFDACMKDVFTKADLNSSSGLYSLAVSTDGGLITSLRFYDYDWLSADDYCGYLRIISPDGKWIPSIDTGYYATEASIGPNGSIFVGFGSNLHAFNPNGIEKWSQYPGGTISSHPIFGNNGEIYFLTSDQKLVAFDEATLKSTWSKEGHTTLPAIDAEGTLYTPSGALNQTDGSKKWSSPSGNFSDVAVASESRVYLFGESGLWALNANDGTLLWKLTQDSLLKQEIAPANLAIGEEGTLYFCNGANNTVYAVYGDAPVDKNAAWSMLRHDSQRTGNYNTK